MGSGVHGGFVARLDNVFEPYLLTRGRCDLQIFRRSMDLLTRRNNSSV
jgi:hypothetical protein